MAPTNRDRGKRVMDADVNFVNEVNYKGMRKRPWGKYWAEIRDPTIKRRRWLGTFATAKEVAKSYDNAAINLKGVRTKTNFVDPSIPLDTVHIERCSPIAATTKLATPLLPHLATPLLPSPPANHNNNTNGLFSSISRQIKPSTYSYMNEACQVQRVSEQRMSPWSTSITIPNMIPTNLIDYAILMQQSRPMVMPLWGKIVAPHMINNLNGNEWVGSAVMNNTLHVASSQTRVYDSSSSSSILDTQLSPLHPLTKEKVPHSLSWIGFSQQFFLCPKH